MLSISFINFFFCQHVTFQNFKRCLMSQWIKNLSALQETQVQSLVWEDPLEEEMTTHSSTLAWKIPWTEEPGRLQSKGLQRVRHNWATKHSHTLKQPQSSVCHERAFPGVKREQAEGQRYPSPFCLVSSWSPSVLSFDVSPLTLLCSHKITGYPCHRIAPGATLINILARYLVSGLLVHFSLRM